MLTTNYGAKLEWDHTTDIITMMVTPSAVIENFNSPQWRGATEDEKLTRWKGLVRQHSQNSKSSLDF